MSALIEFDAVCKYYQMGDTTVNSCRPHHHENRKRRVCCHCGPVRLRQVHLHEHHRLSGCATAGTYRLNGRDVGKMSRNELASIRNEMLGFIFQQYNLLPKLNLLENVEVPLVYAGIPRAERHRRAREVLEQVGAGR